MEAATNEIMDCLSNLENFENLPAKTQKAFFGKFVERIGLYDPKLTENKTTLDKERVEHWLKVGARPTERVVKLFKLQGIEVPATLMDKQAPSAGKQKAMPARAAERQQVQEAKAREEAARAKKKQAAEPAAGGGGPPARA